MGGDLAAVEALMLLAVTLAAQVALIVAAQLRVIRRLDALASRVAGLCGDLRRAQATLRAGRPNGDDTPEGVVG